MVFTVYWLKFTLNFLIYFLSKMKENKGIFVNTVLTNLKHIFIRSKNTTQMYFVLRGLSSYHTGLHA